MEVPLSMELVILSVPDCPNVAVLDERLRTLLVGRDDVHVMHQEVADQRDAQRWGMYGSPTLLVDGVDPFADPDASATVSCRLFRDDKGRVQRAPSLAALRAAMDTPPTT
jgi:hypothetical protein